MNHGHGHPTVVPVLPCRDTATAREFYQRLGFDVDSMGPDYALVLSGHQELFHVRTVNGLSPSTNATMVFVHVDDPDRWHTELASRGVAADSPVDEPWGVREFRFDDPCGNTVRVGRALG
jgi:catechol 2,3-dioxygenase-like lactoylglutathione lyase family enzyme